MVNNYGESFEKNNKWVHELNRNFFPEPIKYLDIQPHENILHHGSRNGSYTTEVIVPEAEKQDCHIYAIEECRSHHEHGKENFDHGRITHINKHFLDPDVKFPDDKIQKIISIYDLFHNDYKKHIEKMYQLLEHGGKVCLVVVTEHEPWFQFFRHMQTHPEWSWHGQDLTVPDYIETFWNGGNGPAVFEETVRSAGFEIEHTLKHRGNHTFDSTDDAAEFFIGVLMASISERNLTSVEMYQLKHREYSNFLKELKESSEHADGSEKFKFEYEIYSVVAKKN